MVLATRLISSTTNDPTAVVVRRYFATSKNTLPSAFLRSQFTQSDYTIKTQESNHYKKTNPLLLAMAVLGFVQLAEAQQLKVPRIAYLSGSSARSQAPRLEAFRQGLRELGYIEGKNIALEYRFAEGKLDRIPGLADELVRLKVDVIVVAGTGAAVPAKKATSAIPIVMANVGDPVKTGLVASFSKPGGNLTGLTQGASELSGKRLELLKEVISGLARVTVLLDPSAPDAPSPLKEMQAAARALGMELQILEVRVPDGLEPSFSTMKKERAGAFTLIATPLFNVRRRQITDLAAKYRLPAM